VVAGIKKSNFECQRSIKLYFCEMDSRESL
jgi:hypothetical protein